MTGLEKILNEIRKESEENVNRIISEGQRAAEEILEEARKNAENEAKKFSESAAAEEAELKERAISQKALNVRNAVLLKKHSIIKDIVSEGKERILNLPDEEYFKFLTGLLNKYAHKEDGTILLCEKDKKRLEEAFKREIDDKGLKISDESLKEDGGFVLIYGDIEERCTVNAIFESKAEKISDIVTKAVFEWEG